MKDYKFLWYAEGACEPCLYKTIFGKIVMVTDARDIPFPFLKIKPSEFVKRNRFVGFGKYYGQIA